MQLTIRMPDEYAVKIGRLAERMGLKKSDVARLAVKRFIEEHMGDEDMSPFEKVRHLVGTAESGIADLGLRHREYLIRKVRRDS